MCINPDLNLISKCVIGHTCSTKVVIKQQLCDMGVLVVYFSVIVIFKCNLNIVENLSDLGPNFNIPSPGRTVTMAIPKRTRQPSVEICLFSYYHNQSTLIQE